MKKVQEIVREVMVEAFDYLYNEGNQLSGENDFSDAFEDSESAALKVISEVVHEAILEGLKEAQKRKVVYFESMDFDTFDAITAVLQEVYLSIADHYA